MSGGVRYWNEEAQRWEDGEGDGGRAATGPVAPPPPAHPDAAPAWPPAAGVDAGTDVPASGWPGDPAGSGGGTTWHGPAASGGPAGGWSSVEQVGAGTVPSAEWSGASWSTAAHPAVTAPPGPSAAPPDRNRRLVLSALIGTAAVGVAVALVLTFVVGGDEDDKAGGASPSPTGSVSRQSDPYGSPTPSPTGETASPLASEPVLPAGYEMYDDKEGFRIARPTGWARTSVTSRFGMDVVNFRSSDGERRLQVYQVAEESPEASFELYLSADTTKPDGFRKLSLQPVGGGDGGFTGERLEYLADTLSGEPDVGPWHVYDERFVAQDGFIYAIAAYGPDEDGREDELDLLTTALSGFCAPYACDAAAID